MSKIEKFLTTTAIIFTGMMVSSLFVTCTDMWKIYLSIALFCVTLKLAIQKS